MKARSRLALGTVQWGLPYGVSNQAGMTPLEEVGRILSSATRQRIEVLDTAALYGDSEAALGAHDLRPFRLVTKTPPFAKPAIGDEDAAELRRTFERSLRRLRVESTYGLLVHHADDICVPGGERLIWALQAIQAEGLVRKIGVSIYDAKQLNAVMEVFRPDIVQLPVSVFDRRLIEDGSLARLHARGVEVHARSVFLQGLLLMRPAELPAFFEPIRPLIERWHDACAEQQMTPVQAALAFVRDVPQIDHCIIGVQNATQLEECVADFSVAGPFDAAGLQCHDVHFLNPALWRLQ